MRPGSVIPNKEKVKALRLARGLTQAQLANLLPIGKRTLENIEAGHRTSRDNLEQLAAYLDVAVAALIVNEETDVLAASIVANDARRNWTKQIGLTSVAHSFHGFPYNELLRVADDLLIVLNDGRSWIQAYREGLISRSNTPTQRTRILLLHPRSDFLTTLVRKNGKDLHVQKSEIERAFRLIASLAPTHHNICLRGHFLFNPYCLFLTERQAIVHPYFYNEAGALPVYSFQAGAPSPMYDRYKDDAEKLYAEASEIQESDFA